GKGLATEAYDSLRQASAHIGKVLRAGDVVLIKGSRAVGMEALVEPIRRAFARRGRKKIAKGSKR
ncbi:MAG: hypothetical protein ACYTF6_12835, partial [Planctomycetota bacterium]